MTLRGRATERPTPAAGMGVWPRPLPIGHAPLVTRRLHPLFFLSPCSCCGRHGRPRRTMADVSAPLAPRALLCFLAALARVGWSAGGGRRGGGGLALCVRVLRGCAGPFHVLLFSRSQQQDKAALIAETRRRFEAEYLLGEHAGCRPFGCSSALCPRPAERCCSVGSRCRLLGLSVVLQGVSGQGVGVLGHWQ